MIVVAPSKAKLFAMLLAVRALLEAEMWGLLKLENQKYIHFYLLFK